VLSYDMLRVCSHPLAQHYLGEIRDKNTPVAEFRRLVHKVTLLLAHDATRDLPLFAREVETPMGSAEASCVRGTDFVVAAILRAGLGMVDAFCELVCGARVAHLGMFRDETSLKPVQYHANVPSISEDSRVVVVDPMLATGGSLAEACSMLKRCGARHLKACCIIAAPEGIRLMQKQHPDVPIHVVAVDERLNSSGYIVPGLGDAGDRLYGTHMEEDGGN